MSKFPKAVAKTLILAMVGAIPPTAAGEDFRIDPKQSMVVFKVKNRDISYVYGFFRKISGMISTNRKENPSQLKIDAEVEIKSLFTNDNKRDAHLRSEEFFDVRENPKITFKTKNGKRIEEGRFELIGELTLHGVTKPLTVEFKQTGYKEISEEPPTSRLGGELTFTIKRSDFGLDSMLDSIADEVTVMINLEAEYKLARAG